MIKTLQILVIEDFRPDYEIVKNILQTAEIEDARCGFQLQWAQTLAEAKALIEEDVFDVILLDFLLPDSDGLNSLAEIQTLDSNPCVIILTGMDSHEVAVEALRHGAQDYLSKNSLQEHMVRTIHYALERKQITQKLLIAERLARIAKEAESRFLANMSHEIRTPLTAIIGFGEALLDESQQISERRQAAQTIVQNGQHLLGLLNDVLDFSKIESGELKVEIVRFAPYSIVVEALSAFQEKARKKDLKLIIEPTYPLPEAIQSDPLRFRQILFNLLGNAIRFTEQGEIKIRIRAEKENNLLWCSVSDTGIGISAEQQAEIFKPFNQANASTTRRFGGTGLGLAISNELAAHLGGSISLQSKPGLGSTFMFSVATGDLSDVPFIEGGLSFARQPSPGRLKTIPSLSGNVLLVEDCESNQELISYLIGRTGASLTIASNGYDGAMRAAQNNFDIVLMDIQMAEIDGFKTTSLLRANSFAKPIIALTANASSEFIRGHVEAGFSGYLAKPFDQQSFYALLARYLRPAESPHTATSASSSKARLEGITTNYVKQLPQKIGAVTEALDRADWTTLAANAHVLASADMFELPEIGEVARQLENSAKALQTQECCMLVTKLMQLSQTIAHS